jgi:hypothetical protein
MRLAAGETSFALGWAPERALEEWREKLSLRNCRQHDQIKSLRTKRSVVSAKYNMQNIAVHRLSGS